MADYYIEAAVAVPSSWPEAARQDFYDIVCFLNTEANFNEYYELSSSAQERVDPILLDAIAGYDCWLQGTLWKVPYEDSFIPHYGDLNNFEEDIVVTIIQYLANKYKIDDENCWTFGVAYTCSKLCVDGFGGTTHSICSDNRDYDFWEKPIKD